MATSNVDDSPEIKKHKKEDEFVLNRIFHSFIANILKSGELLSSPKIKKIIGEDVAKAYRSNKDLTEAKKVQHILDLISESSTLNKWEIFVDVLANDCDFAFVPDILLKRYDPETERHLQKLLDVFGNEEVDTGTISNVLRNIDLITDIDVQDIDTECLNRDGHAGFLVLIDRVITLDPESWYTKFLQCLKQAGMEETVQSIDAEFDKSANNDENIEIEVTSDDHWRKLIMELCHGHIVKIVIPSGLLTNMAAVFDMADKRLIRSLEKTKSPEEAMEKLLEMLDKKDCPGKWQIFKQALVEDDYEWVKDFIEGNFVSYRDSEKWELLINMFEKTLSETIKPQEILPWLRQQEIITEKDSQEVEQMCRNYGENEAVFRLLTFLPKRKPNTWYPEFLEILYKNGYDETVNEVDPDMFKKFNQVHGSMDSDMETTEMDSPQKCVDKEEMIQEAYMSATERPVLSKNLTSPCSPQAMTNLNVDFDDDLTKQKLLAKEKVEDSFNKLSESNIESTAQSDSGQIELNSLIVENAKRAIAMEVCPAEQRNITHYDTVGNSDLDSDSDNEKIVTEELRLRSYQMELARPALTGKNCIIVAPTGSGKTYVALKIIQDHIEKTTGRFPKVVFLVEQSALAKQQADQCKKYLSQYRIKLITGEKQREAKLPKSMSSWLNRRDILVVTAQILVNAIRENDIKIEDFTLIVFDECHHAHAKHAYSQIMHTYMELKMDENADKAKLPMVVGMTASVGVGRATTEHGAEEHIQKMMANLDAEELATVKETLPDLSEYVIVPEQCTVHTKGRKKNYFGEMLVTMMNSIEKYMIDSKFASFLPDNGGILKGPADKGSDPYTQWISKLWRETAKINNQDARRYFETCRLYLELYNKVLIIYEDARVKDAVQYLEQKLKSIKEGAINDKTDEKMLSIYEKGKPVLLSCVDHKDHVNPKLDDLKDIIFKQYSEKPESRVIVFIKTRDLVQAIENWMKETDGLSCLKPVKFVGTQASGEKGGMTKNDQDDILKLFRTGLHKIIIATSVAEEGLDIQTCNLVIRYDHVTNEIAMVQARGRGRAEESKFVVIASEKRGTAEKEEINLIREARMNEAIKKVQESIRRNKSQFLADIEKIQKSDKKKRDLEKLSKKRTQRNSEFVLRCGKCSTYICMSSDIKKIQDAHHAVINEEVRNNITTEKSEAKRIDNLTTCGVGKVKCKTCGKELGNVTIHKGAQFPVLKIDGFLVADSAAKTNVYKRWKSVPFCPDALLEEDLEVRLQGQPYVQDCD